MTTVTAPHQHDVNRLHHALRRCIRQAAQLTNPDHRNTAIAQVNAISQALKTAMAQLENTTQDTTDMTSQPDHVPFTIGHQPRPPAKPAGEGAPALPGFNEIHQWAINGTSPEEIQARVADAFDKLKAWAGNDPTRTQAAEKAYFESIKQLADIMIAWRS